jgi:nucleoside-diphosphate-sugar epimerase
VLVTGGGGFVGGHVVDLLIRGGDDVRVLAQLDEDVSRVEADVEVCRGDLRDRSSIEAAVDGVDRVLHCAARTGPWGDEVEYAQVNVLGVQSLVEAALAAGVERFVHVSSIAVHGTDVNGDADETAPLRAASDPYSTTKAAGERVIQRMIKRSDATVTIVRPGLVYGPRDNSGFARFAALIEQGRMPIIGSGHNHVPLIHVSDVARGIVLAADAADAIGKAYLLVGEETVTQREYFSAIADELAVAPPRIHVPYHVALALGASAEAVWHLFGRHDAPPVMRFGVRQLGGENRFSGRKARDELGFSPEVRLADGVRQSVAWYRIRANGGAMV